MKHRYIVFFSDGSRADVVNSRKIRSTKELEKIEEMCKHEQSMKITNIIYTGWTWR